LLAVWLRVVGRAATFDAFFTDEIAGCFVFLTGCAAGFSFDLTAFVFVALCARALPAGDRLVAGFRRVSFAFADDLIERRVDDRGESFLTLLATGVLMRELPRVDEWPSNKPQRKQRERVT
jgi:hypothetical protein